MSTNNTQLLAEQLLINLIERGYEKGELAGIVQALLDTYYINPHIKLDCDHLFRAQNIISHWQIVESLG